jgi:hypothetical protein
VNEGGAERPKTTQKSIFCIVKAKAEQHGIGFRLYGSAHLGHELAEWMARFLLTPGISFI